MRGEAEVLYSSRLSLLYKIIDNSPFRVVVNIKDVFADIVKQVKIEILNSAFFKLFFKNICGVVAFAYLMPGIFVRKKI